MAEFKLKRNWHDVKENFCERTEEYNRIKQFLAKGSGSLLICGKRGIGKTQLIKKIIEEEQEKVFVEIDLSKIFPLSTNSEKKENTLSENLKREFLIEMIKGLNQKVKLWKFPLIKKRLCILNRRSKGRWAQESEKQKVFSLDLGSEFLLFSIGIIALSLILKKLTPENWGSTVEKIQLILASVDFIILKYKIARKETQTITNDNNYILEELTEIIKNFDKKREIVFVIDEIDFIEAGEKTLKYSDLFTFLKHFKSLFNQTDASFIFIGSNETYTQWFDAFEKESVYKSIFQETLYLANPHKRDIDNYLDSILDQVKSTKGDWTTYKDMLFYRTKGTPLDLRGTIADQTQFGNIIINYTKEDEKLLNFYSAVANLAEQAQQMYGRSAFSPKADLKDFIIDFIWDEVIPKASHSSIIQFIDYEDKDTVQQAASYFIEQAQIRNLVKKNDTGMTTDINANPKGKIIKLSWSTRIDKPFDDNIYEYPVQIEKISTQTKSILTKLKIRKAKKIQYLEYLELPKSQDLKVTDIKEFQENYAKLDSILNKEMQNNPKYIADLSQQIQDLHIALDTYCKEIGI